MRRILYPGYSKRDYAGQNASWRQIAKLCKESKKKTDINSDQPICEILDISHIGWSQTIQPFLARSFLQPWH